MTLPSIAQPSSECKKFFEQFFHKSGKDIEMRQGLILKQNRLRNIKLDHQIVGVKVKDSSLSISGGKANSHKNGFILKILEQYRFLEW